MAKTYALSAKLPLELGEQVDKLKETYFNGNRNALVIKALGAVVDGYNKVEGKERDPPSLKMAEVHLEAEYIREVLLQGEELDCVAIKKEVEHLCKMLV